MNPSRPCAGAPRPHHLRSAAAELYAPPANFWRRATGNSWGELPGVLLRYEWPEDPHGASRRSALRNASPEWLHPCRLVCPGGAVPAAEHIAALEQARRRVWVYVQSEARCPVNASL